MSDRPTIEVPEDGPVKIRASGALAKQLRGVRQSLVSAEDHLKSADEATMEPVRDDFRKQAADCLEAARLALTDLDAKLAEGEPEGLEHFESAEGVVAAVARFRTQFHTLSDRLGE